MSTAVVPNRSPGAASARASSVRAWIISPFWDLALLIAAPLAIVPLVTLSVGHLIDAEELSLVVISFATLGHHLPGFLRAYGDRELFARYRLRFVLAPPIVLGIALVAAALSLHGLSLILLIWATWHGLMQTYGFMRIYDLKQGTGERSGARLDLALCLVIFTAGLVMSDARVYGIADVIAKTGLPLPGPAALSAARWALGIAAAVVIAAYVYHLAGRFRRRAPLAWPRVALALSTGWLYWLGGVLATDLLIGIATFEIFHALQYHAIVWSYNRGRRKSDALARPLAALLRQDRWASLLLYVAIVAAFGSIRLLGEIAGDSWPQRVLMALLTMSTFLHFYFDGFIWKVSDRKMQAGLAIADRPASGVLTATTAPAPEARWCRRHAVLCTGLGVLAVGLMTCELVRPLGAASEQESLAQLAALMPKLPELQWRISDEALKRGDATRAFEAAEAAVALRPYSQQAFARLGTAALAADRQPEAAAALREAVRLGPRRWNNHCNLGIALGNLGEWDEANRAFEQADRLEPRNASIHAAWARMCERRRDDGRAVEHYRAALAADPADAESRAALVLLLSRGGDHDEAVDLARAGSERDPASPDAQLSLGKALVAAGRFEQAISTLQPLAELASQPPTATVGTAMAGPAASMAKVGRAAGRTDIARSAGYELAVAQLQLGRLDDAEQNLLCVLKLDPQMGLAHFQLGNLRHARGDLPARSRLIVKRSTPTPTLHQRYAIWPPC